MSLNNVWQMPNNEKMVITPPAITRRIRDNDRGAAIVEFALVAIVLFTIVFGLIEGGLLVRAHNSIANATDDAARRGAIAGDAESADWQILQQLKARGATTQFAIDYVVVYQADNGSDTPSAACLAGTPVTDECNVYTTPDFALDASAFGCGGAPDSSWCPEDRAPGAAFGYLGVLVAASHDAVIGTITFDLQASSTLPIETSGES